MIAGDISRRWLEDACDDLQERRFAAAVVTVTVAFVGQICGDIVEQRGSGVTER